MNLACAVDSGGRKWWILSVTSCGAATPVKPVMSSESRTKIECLSVMIASGQLFSRYHTRIKKATHLLAGMLGTKANENADNMPCMNTKTRLRHGNLNVRGILSSSFQSH